jgi:hypothetical protein
MSMNDREVLEAIRQLVLRPQPDPQYVAEIAREFARQVSNANHNLNRCQRWIQLGLFAEAVSFGEALDLAKSSARLLLQGMFGQWGELCRAANVLAPESIDQSLLESYSDAWSRFHSLAQIEARHRLLSLQRAPLLERLQVLRELVDLDSRNPEWLRSITRLQRQAAGELTQIVAQALQEKDDALAIAVSQLVDACAGTQIENQAQFEQLKQFAAAAKRRVAFIAARLACDEMHNAAVSMDLQELRAANLRWQVAIREFEPDEELRQSAAASLQLLVAQQQREQRERDQQDALGRLELALDQAKSFVEIQALILRANNLDATIPKSLAMRVAALQDAHTAVGRRRFARRSIMVSIVTVVLAVTAWWIIQWQRSVEEVEAIAREVEALLTSGSPDTALKSLSSWKESHVDLAAAPQVVAVGAKVTAALDTERAAVAAAAQKIEQAQQLLQSPAYPAQFEQAAQELKQLATRAPKSIQPQLLTAVDQLLAKATASRAAALDQARAEFMRLESALTALQPMSAAEQVDPDSWSRRAGEYQLLVDAAKIAANAAATNRDAQAIAESLQAMALNATRLRDEALQNAKMYAQAAELLKSVERIPASESAYRDLYVRLLPIASDVLVRRKQLKAFEHGLKVAEGGAAVEAWRQSMVPAILAGRVGDIGGLNAVDFGDIATARSLEPMLSKHLADFPSSPHQSAAELLRGICRRTLTKSANTEGIGQAAGAWLAQSGWTSLGEQSMDDGRKLYRKRVGSLGDPWAQAVQSKNDLATPAESLKARAPLKGQLMGVNIPWAPSQALITLSAELPKASWRQARDMWLDALAKESSIAPSNPILSWHLQKDLWMAWLDYFAEESDPVDAAAAKWVRSLESLRAVSASDPFIVAASDQAARSEDIRKVALQSLASMPDISALIKAAKKRDQSMDEGMLPAALVAVMLSPQDGAYPVRGIANGKDALIVGRSMEGTWKFFAIRVENNEVLFVRDTPNPIAQSPQLIFMRGVSK